MGVIEAIAMVAAGGAGASDLIATRKEAKSLKKQGNLAAEEAEATAQRAELEGERFQTRQKLNFLKNGVSLAGSPLLTLAETGEETKTQSAAIRRAGGSRRTFLRDQAGAARGKGRSALLATISSGSAGAAGTGGGGGSTPSGGGGGE